MKFINYLESISGVGVYPMISFMIFFLFFIGLGVYVLKTPKRYIDEVQNIPLDSGEINELTNTKTV